MGKILIFGEKPSSIEIFSSLDALSLKLKFKIGEKRDVTILKANRMMGTKNITKWSELEGHISQLPQLPAYFLCSYCLGLLMASEAFSQLCSKLASSQQPTAPTTLHPTPPTQSPTWRPLSTLTQPLTLTTPQEAPHHLYRFGLHLYFSLLFLSKETTNLLGGQNDL